MMTLLIMAAGKGSRYGTLKQFDGLGPQREFLMEYSIFDAIQVGFQHIIVVTQEARVDFLNTYLKNRLPSDIQLTIIAQRLTDLPLGISLPKDRQKPWGTAHAVWTARHIIKAGFVVINADDFYGKEAFKNAIQFLQNSTTSTDFGLISYPLFRTLSTHGAVSRGICHIKNHFLVKIEERTRIAKEGNKIVDLDAGTVFTGEEQISMNFWICQPSFFKSTSDHLKSFIQNKTYTSSKELYIPTVISSFISNGKIPVHCIPSASEWFGVTYLKDKTATISKLQEMTKQQLYPTPLWNVKNE